MSKSDFSAAVLNLLFENFNCGDPCAGGWHRIEVGLYVDAEGRVALARIVPYPATFLELLNKADRVALEIDRRTLDRLTPLAVLIKDEFHALRTPTLESMNACLRAVVDSHNAHVGMLS